MDPDVSKTCLRGKPVPPPLARLWAAREAGDGFLEETLELTLLTSLRSLESGYGDPIASESEDIAANVRAHRTVFEQLGFFAEDGDGGFLAFDLTSTRAEDPPVAYLDSEGQYEWLGANLGQALLQRAEARGCEPAMIKWLRANGIETGALGTFGVSTQFFRSLRDQHAGLYHAYRGEPRAVPASSSAPATDDPATWFLRPGAEVAPILTKLLNGPSDEPWVACDGEGRVNAIWFRRVPETENIRVRGVRFGDDAASVERLLGAPDEHGEDWLLWKHGSGLLRIGLRYGVVSGLELYAAD